MYCKVLAEGGNLTYNPGEKLNNKVGFGLGLNFPFGLSNRYPSQTTMARYAGYRNQIKLAAIDLAAGVKINDKFSVGASAVNYRIMQYDQSFNYPNAAVLGPSSSIFPSPDGKVDLYQKGSSWGWTASALLKPLEKHNIGVHYRSKVDIRTSGRVVVTGLVQGIIQGFDTDPYWERDRKSVV